MKRLMFAAVAGLCSFASAEAQEGVLAPTVPIVPTPHLQEGKALRPVAGTGTFGVTEKPRMFSLGNWSPFRSLATAGPAESALPPAVASPAYPYHGYAIPPLPAGVSTAGGGMGAGLAPAADCGPAGCGKGHDRTCWERFKAWLCFHYTDTSYPRCQPKPYITPLQGMFPCTPGWPSGCATGGCAPGQPAYAPPAYGQPVYPGYPQPMGEPVQPMPQPTPPKKPGSDTPPAVLPTRGVRGAALPPPTRGRVDPATYQSVIEGYTVAKPATLPGTVVNAGGRR